MQQIWASSKGQLIGSKLSCRLFYIERIGVVGEPDQDAFQIVPCFFGHITHGPEAVQGLAWLTWWTFWMSPWKRWRRWETKNLCSDSCSWNSVLNVGQKRIDGWIKDIAWPNNTFIFQAWQYREGKKNKRSYQNPLQPSITMIAGNLNLCCCQPLPFYALWQCNGTLTVNEWLQSEMYIIHVTVNYMWSRNRLIHIMLQYLCHITASVDQFNVLWGKNCVATKKTDQIPLLVADQYLQPHQNLPDFWAITEATWLRSKTTCINKGKKCNGSSSLIWYVKKQTNIWTNERMWLVINFQHGLMAFLGHFNVSSRFEVRVLFLFCFLHRAVLHTNN